MNKGRKKSPSSKAARPADSGSCRVTLSGGFLQIFGLGVIIIGHSGIGKSESALELISRGHRFISDDVVEVRRRKDGSLIGNAPSLSRYFMEIRGLGIINIKEIFGLQAISRQSRVDLIIRLKKWQRGDEYDRLGLEFPEDFEILGVKIPQLIVPVAPGRTIALLIEIACKVHLLRKKGYHASREIVKRLDKALA
jgi:HPr kinase/phosphorylase